MSGYHSREPLTATCPKCRGQHAGSATVCPYCGHERFKDPIMDAIMPHIIAWSAIGYFFYWLFT